MCYCQIINFFFILLNIVLISLSFLNLKYFYSWYFKLKKRIRASSQTLQHGLEHLSKIKKHESTQIEWMNEWKSEWYCSRNRSPGCVLRRHSHRSIIFGILWQHSDFSLPVLIFPLKLFMNMWFFLRILFFKPYPMCLKELDWKNEVSVPNPKNK